MGIRSSPRHAPFGSKLFGDRKSLLLALEILEQLKRNELEQLAACYPHVKGDPASGKYLCVGAALVRATFNAQSLNLGNVCATKDQRMRVLDIGSGAGFFPFTAKYLGHDVEAIDVDDEPLYRELTALLGIHRTIHRVSIENPLPDYGQRFDLITAFQLLFDRDARLPDGIWGLKDWEKFLYELRANHLTEKGTVFIGLNSGLTQNHLRSLDELFVSLGSVRRANGYHITFSKTR